MPTIVKPAKFILDGKKIRDQDVTESDLAKAEYLVDGSVETANEDIEFGFTQRGKFEQWVGKQSKNEQQAYHGLQKMLDRAGKMEDKTEEELSEIKTFQIERVRRKTKHFMETVEKNYDISTVTPEDIVQLTKEFDPLYGPDSMSLYRWPNFSLNHRYPVLKISTGVHWNLDWYRFAISWDDWDGKGWGDRTTSYINPDGAFIMFKDKWCVGPAYVCLFPRKRKQMSSSWDNNLDSIVYGSYWDIVTAIAIFL